MFKMLLVFVGLWVGIALGIQQVLHMNQSQRWSMLKVASYALVCAALTLGTLSVIVALF